MPVPLCRCRVLYVGSAVPTVTKDGLQGIQQPLKERYPIDQKTETKGIDSWLSVWSNGLLVEYIDGSKKTESAFYPITNMHYCAAVRYVNVNGLSVEGGGERFMPLDVPFANPPDSPHPPIFAAIFRRTTGVKVLECHAFICTNEKAANALVRCCFHSYADTISLKMEDKIPGLKAIKENSRSATPSSDQNMSDQAEENIKDEADWQDRAICQKTWQRRQQSGEYDSLSVTTSLKGYKKSAKSQDNNETALQAYQGDSRAKQPHPNMINPGYGGFIQVSQEAGRRGSADSVSSNPGAATFRPRPLMMPPPMMPPHYGMVPPHMMPPHPHMMHHPHHMMHGGPGMPPPYFMRPMYGPFPFTQRPLSPPYMYAQRYPPHMYHPHMRPAPRMMFMPRPPFGMHPSYMAERPRTPTDGPIITSADSIYDTFPRGGGNYEEPVYAPGNGGQQQEGDFYYEINRQFHGHRQRNSKSESADDSFDDARLWDQYEARIYRQPHMNERAFADTLVIDTPVKKGSPTPTDPNTPSTSGAKRAEARPSTPPADYESADFRANDDHAVPERRY